MSYQNIIFEKADRIATLTINRPAVLNALNHETLLEMQDAIKTVEEDENIRVLVITGAPDDPPEGKRPKPRAFVAGADIVLMSGIEPGDRESPAIFANSGHGVMRRLENLRVPVIAAVDGFALGGGTELAISCDIIYASDRASFGQPEVKLGLIPGFGGTQRLPRLVGKGIATEIACTGRKVDAEEALRIGLVNKVVGADELLTACEKLLQRTYRVAPLSVRYVLDAIHNGMEMTLAEGCAYEEGLFGVVCSTEDSKEGIAAFLEKRDAQFKGK